MIRRKRPGKQFSDRLQALFSYFAQAGSLDLGFGALDLAIQLEQSTIDGIGNSTIVNKDTAYGHKSEKSVSHSFIEVAHA
jgi:hypothetical protein